MNQKLGQGPEFAVKVAGYKQFDITGSADFLEELAAMATGGGGSDEVIEVGLSVEGEIGDEELLCVDGMVKREAGELEVNAEEDPAGGSKADGNDVVVGNWRAGKALGGLDETREELGEGEASGFGHGFCVRCLDHESGLLHLGLAGEIARKEDATLFR